MKNMGKKYFRMYGVSWRYFAAFPFIYAVIVPLVILDIVLEIYHRICFPLFGIPVVDRSRYIRIDRHKLSYLNVVEKVHCVYCGYGNGLMYYAWTILGRTEKYWCAIKHKRDEDFNEPPHHKDFIEYGDEKGYEELAKERLMKLTDKS